jgi:catechol 2,3-dioxygenase-like lactoylglutathione lyase family enzyme
MASPARGQGSPGAPTSSVRTTVPLRARIQGVQHFGITVQNMDRAFEFYTAVLGGTELARSGDVRGEPMHNALFLYEEIEACRREVDPKSIGAPDLRGGTQPLDLRLVRFGDVTIELLQYRDRQQPEGSGRSFADPLDRTSPAYPRAAHICFQVGDEVDFDLFIRDLEAEAARRGMTNVKANRVITVPTEEARRQAPLESNTNKITEGPYQGLAMIYAKGPEGEQLEFVQVLGRAKQLFGDEARRRT